MNTQNIDMVLRDKLQTARLAFSIVTIRQYIKQPLVSVNLKFEECILKCWSVKMMNKQIMVHFC